MLAFLRKRRRDAVRREPFPPAWREILDRNVPCFGRLPAEDRQELLGHIQVFAAPVRVGVLDDGGDLRDTCREDDFVGACAAIVSTARHEDTLRFHFVSADGRNDWTAVTSVSVD